MGGRVSATRRVGGSCGEREGRSGAVTPIDDELVLGVPEIRLRPFVDRYIGYRERADVPLVRRETAGAFVVLILGWGAPLDVADPRGAERGVERVDSFVAGTFDGWCTTRTVGVGEGVELLLTPLTARRVLGLPLAELTNRAVGLGHLPGRWLEQLRHQLADAEGWPQRFALLDAALADRLAASPPVDARLDWAWRWLTASGGRGAVGELAAELGWSRRHLAARFREDVGLPPKTAARLMRFQHAHAALRDAAATGSPPGRGRAVDWAEVAVRCGYYDQSHLIRDFHQFAGATPAALLAAPSAV
ncbi:helix-turn-helix domain-containing protein [Micromonospora sp. NPDC005979]|uniref:AraC family transcriptional regulator n=1 Tax=Micromonospora sp. NPDC005979 TaxID=3156726 RepID=UPI0033A53CA7